jgi:hypothetical protein
VKNVQWIKIVLFVQKEQLNLNKVKKECFCAQGRGNNYAEKFVVIVVVVVVKIIL